MAGAATAGAAPTVLSGRAFPVGRVDTRDAAWFATVYQTTLDRVYRYAWMLVRDSSRAEDVVAEVYLRAWNARHSLKDEQSALAWLMSIAHNCAYSQLRAIRDMVDVEAVMNEPDNTPPPEAGLLLAATRDQLQKALLHLTAEQQQVIFLRFVEGQSHEVVASRMHKKPNAVRAIQFRALNRLRSLLEGTDAHVQA